MEGRSNIPYGRWIWDDNEGGLVFVSQETTVKPRTSTKSALGMATSFAGCTHADLNITFNDSVDTLEKIRFRRHFQRRVKANEPDVITIRDVKDVVLFQTQTSLAPEFIDFFHTLEIDRLLRALILYFQLFIQTYDILMLRHEISEKKLRRKVLPVEERFRRNLSVLRAMVAREYSNILLGNGNLHHFHHMANKQRISNVERDIRLFESLYRLSGRVVWIALRRHYGNLIENELNRLFRTDAFNIATHQAHRRAFSMSTRLENSILHGHLKQEAKLSAHSPLCLELQEHHDYRMLGIGYVNFRTGDPVTLKMEQLLECPEEDLAKADLTVGILGLPRAEFDAMLIEIPKHLTESEASSKVSSLDSSKSQIINATAFTLPSDHVLEPTPGNFPRNSVPSPDYHQSQRDDARNMWKTHFSHPVV